MYEILLARGVDHLPSETCGYRWIKCVNKYLTNGNDEKKIILRASRTQDQLRGSVTPDSIARYFMRMEKILLLRPRIRALLFADETGFSGYTPHLKTLRVVTTAEFRQETFRYGSAIQDHITILPPILVIVDAENQSILNIHHLPPLFVFPRKHVLTSFAQSLLDPSNRHDEKKNAFNIHRGGHKKVNAPPGLPAPTEFKRFVAASTSGNVNSEIVRKYFVKAVRPFLRARKIPKLEQTLIAWDRHGSHESLPLLQLFDDELLISLFSVPHATNWTQLQGAENGPFSVF